MTVFQRWILGIIISLAIIIIVYYVWQLSISNYPAAHNSKLDLESTAWIGDFIGGVLGPFFTFLTIVLLVDQNNNQRTQNVRQNQFGRDERLLTFISSIINEFDRHFSENVEAITDRNGIYSLIFQPFNGESTEVRLFTIRQMRRRAIEEFNQNREELLNTIVSLNNQLALLNTFIRRMDPSQEVRDLLPTYIVNHFVFGRLIIILNNMNNFFMDPRSREDFIDFLLGFAERLDLPQQEFENFRLRETEFVDLIIRDIRFFSFLENELRNSPRDQ